jgi:hypothetical protein
LQLAEIWRASSPLIKVRKTAHSLFRDEQTELGMGSVAEHLPSMHEVLGFFPSTKQEHLRGFNPQISTAMLSLPKGGGGWMQISEWWLLEGLRLLLGVLHQVAKSLTEVPPTGFQLHWKWEMRNRAPGKDLCAHGEERTTESRGKGDKWTASCIHPSLHYKGFLPGAGPGPLNLRGLLAMFEQRSPGLPVA